MAVFALRLQNLDYKKKNTIYAHVLCILLKMKKKK